MLRNLHPSRIVFISLALCMLLAACGQSTPTSGNTNSATATPAPTTLAPATLKVFAAASLKSSFTAIQTQYQQAHPNVKIVYNFAGSQALVQQITQGAPADVFASADQKNMKKLTDAALATDPKTFADNTLTIIVPTSNPAHITGLKDLANKGIKIDVAASTVPVGSYTLQVLDKFGKASVSGATDESAIKANFVSQEDNDTAIVQKVELGEVDAGIVYASDVTTAAASKVSFIAIPTGLNVIAQYPIAVLKNATDTNDAQAFVQYVLSSDGQAILTKYRFLPPTASS
ncbi:MAG: molybdate ABC transporter substrate-binding protein [Ktedonobacteraceae bacterium]|nr:molybdate ABC transporter substrate-binding protein [Ktedonobacteraceae bacterium]